MNIKLDPSLKFVNVVSSGIEAKIVIKDGHKSKWWKLNYEEERNFHDQDEVEVNGEHYIINALTIISRTFSF